MIDAPRLPALGQNFSPKACPQKMSQVREDRTASGPGASGTTVKFMIGKCTAGSRVLGIGLVEVESRMESAAGPAQGAKPVYFSRLLRPASAKRKPAGLQAG